MNVNATQLNGTMMNNNIAEINWTHAYIVKEKLTGHVNSNGNLMGLVKLDMETALRLTTFSPRMGVTTSPYVHADVVSIFTWYCFRQTLNLVLQTPEHSPVLDTLPEQHLPKLSLPYSFTKDFSLSSNTPEALTCKKIIHARVSPAEVQSHRARGSEILRDPVNQNDCYQHDRLISYDRVSI